MRKFNMRRALLKIILQQILYFEQCAYERKLELPLYR